MKIVEIGHKLIINGKRVSRELFIVCITSLMRYNLGNTVNVAVASVSRRCVHELVRSKCNIRTAKHVTLYCIGRSA